ncbi:APC family permease [Phytoactinopolyspora halotolerans]|uniref:APC family permease n=2 Tax=Phytoactinopolyspora halotolerans TaxID=1981512 RepID=A0A6L9S4G5_9ACTN|nr:APC family permease [Phytoactinopolyspora halotolerans]
MTGDGDAAPTHDAQRMELSKTFKPSWIWAVALGSAVGWGAFVLPTDWMSTAGPLGAILGFGIGGALMLIIAVSYGTLIRTFPVSGGEFAYALSAFGRNHAVLCGWFLTLGYICIVALNASALALLARYVLPDIAEQGRLYEVAGWDVYLGEVLIATLALLIFAYLNIRGTTLSGRLQLVFCVVMLVGVASMLVGVLLHPDGQLGDIQPMFPDDKSAWAAILAIVAIAPWAYVGFDNVPQAAEEFAFSPRKAFRLIVAAITVAAMVYAAMILVTAGATSWTALVAEDPRWGTGDAVSDLFGDVGTTLLAISVSMGICTGLNGFYLAASRLLFAMGRGQMIPSVFARLHPVNRTPYIGIAFVCGVCLVAPWFGREALLWVVDMSAVGVTIAYTYTCLVALRLSVRPDAVLGPDAPQQQLETVRSRTSARTQIVGLLGVLTGLAFLALLLVPASPAALSQESLTALAVWVVLGLVIYLLRRKENAKLSDERLSYLVLGRD